MKKLFLIFCLSIACVGTAKAQQMLNCGIEVTKPPFLVDQVKLQQQKMLFTAPYQVRLFVHICADDDGSNLAVTDNVALMRYLEKVRDHYAAHNVCFSLAGIDTVRNTLLNYCITDDEFTQDRLQNNSIGSSLNVFFHTTLKKSNGNGFLGNAYDIPNDVCSILGNQIGDANGTTLAHELGHCFGLYHTFETAFGTERVPRNGIQSNCSSAGDLLCDTEADPNSDGYRMVDYINAACMYTGDKTDLYGNTYNPPIRNLMAYGRDECKDEFTPQQSNRLQSIVLNTHSYLLNEDNVLKTNTGTWNNSVFTLTARNTYTIAPGASTTNSYVLTGSNKTNIVAGNYIDIKPGAQFNPTFSKGFVEMRVNTLCN